MRYWFFRVRLDAGVGRRLRMSGLTLAMLLPFQVGLGPARVADVPTAARPSSAAALSAERIAQIETEVAPLLQRRVDATGPQLALIDYQVDMRLLERWMLLRAADPKTPPELSAVVFLRVATLRSAGEQVSARVTGSNKALAPAQLDGLSRLHQLTFKLPPTKGAAVMDDVCKSIAPDLILAANATPAEVKNLPAMRPQATGGGASTQPAGAAPTLAQLSERAKQVQASPAIKRQLAVLVDAAETASVDPKGADEAAGLQEMLGACVELSEGLASSTGIDAADRPKIERQLGEGLALFNDARTRSAGLHRVAALTQYRKTLERVERLHIPPSLAPRFAPALVWANANPDGAEPVLSAIEDYLAMCQRDDARKESPTSAGPYRRGSESLHKQFATQRAGFLEDTQAMSGGQGTVFTEGPANVLAREQTMAMLQQNLLKVDQLSHAVQVLSTYKLRPAAALEKRALAAAADLGAPAPAGPRDASIAFVNDVEHLAMLAETLSPPATLSPQTLKLYTRDRLPAVENRKTALLTSLASSLAASKDMDPLDLSNLQTLHDLYDALPLANDVENAVAKSDQLTRWVDWAITPAQLRAMVGPYREGTFGAFAGFADDNVAPMSRWADLHKRYVPLLLLIQEASTYADACADFPTGLSGDIAKLLTPMEGAPFERERQTSLSVMLWQDSAAAADQAATDAIFDAMLGRLRRDFHLQ